MWSSLALILLVPGTIYLIGQLFVWPFIVDRKSLAEAICDYPWPFKVAAAIILILLFLVFIGLEITIQWIQDTYENLRFSPARQRHARA